MIAESATEFGRLREAYIASKRAKYRSAAPIGGCGNIIGVSDFSANRNRRSLPEDVLGSFSLGPLPSAVPLK